MGELILTYLPEQCTICVAVIETQEELAKVMQQLDHLALVHSLGWVPYTVVQTLLSNNSWQIRHLSDVSDSQLKKTAGYMEKFIARFCPVSVVR